MSLLEFQGEPGQAVALTKSDQFGPPRWMPDPQARTAVESLLLALRFRNWLGDSEKDFLDLLAPEHSVTFLIHNREYLHPEGVSLFPMELIETALNGGGQAIFTHRYQPQRSSDHDCYKVHTARFSPLDGDEWILGTLGPDSLYGGPSSEDRFGQVVEMFRRAWLATDHLESRVKARLEEDRPVLLINRASGRVLAAGERTAELLGAEVNELVDAEYSEISRRLNTGTDGFKLQLENLSTSPIQLCVATIQTRPKPSRRALPDALIADFFIHTMRNKLSGITAAASHLGSLAEEVDARDEIELSDIVLSEAGQLDREMDRLLTLVAYDRLPPRTVSVEQSLSDAVRYVLSREGRRAAIAREQNLSERTFQCPPPALALLFESVMLSHLNHQRQPSRTRVSFTEQASYTEVRVSTVLENPTPDPNRGRNWLICAEHLAALMNVRLSHEETDERTEYTSTLRIPYTG